MLRSTTHSTDMHRSALKMTMMTIMVMMALTVVADAQAPCDPVTQYKVNDQCCKMCPRGTFMTSLGTCLEPQCQECGPNMYQDKYTREASCDRQPYCDPNLNFVPNPEHKKTKRTTCMCKPGFHCSAEVCKTCAVLTTCKPGSGVKSRGNQTHDTVCEDCPEGTYSDEDSWEGACKPWTKCEETQHIGTEGTDRSDSVCVENSRTHIVVIIAVVTGVVVLGLALGLIYLLKGARGNPEGNLKVCFESCRGGNREPLREEAPNVCQVLITNPTEPDEDSISPEVQSSQEEGFTRTPEENMDELSQEVSTEVGLSENGKVVMQDNGKSEILSRQESQTQTF